MLEHTYWNVYFFQVNFNKIYENFQIPFSKFVFSSRGYVQDTQEPIPLCDVAWIGITLKDDIDGPFNLEIEYIGLEEKTSHTEEHAYESYNFDNYFFK